MDGIKKLQDNDGDWYWIPDHMVEDFNRDSSLLAGVEFLDNEEGHKDFMDAFDRYRTGGDRDLMPKFFKEEINNVYDVSLPEDQGSIGVAAIALERRKQIAKGRSLEYDKQWKLEQLKVGAVALLVADTMLLDTPTGWDEEAFKNLRRKPYKDRLRIAGAFIAAELDRIG